MKCKNCRRAKPRPPHQGKDSGTRGNCTPAAGTLIFFHHRKRSAIMIHSEVQAGRARGPTTGLRAAKRPIALGACRNQEGRNTPCWAKCDLVVLPPKSRRTFPTARARPPPSEPSNGGLGPGASSIVELTKSIVDGTKPGEPDRKGRNTDNGDHGTDQSATAIRTAEVGTPSSFRFTVSATTTMYVYGNRRAAPRTTAPRGARP